MSSSIEPEFNPPDNLSREEVIKLAQHYVNYWKIECNSYVYKYTESLNDLHKAKNRTEELWEHFQKIYKEKAEWQPIETAPKDGMILLYGKIKDENKIGIGCYYYALKFFVIEDGKGCYRLDATHWMPLPNPPTQDCVE